MTPDETVRRAEKLVREDPELRRAMLDRLLEHADARREALRRLAAEHRQLVLGSFLSHALARAVENALRGVDPGGKVLRAEVSLEWRMPGEGPLQTRLTRASGEDPARGGDAPAGFGGSVTWGPPQLQGEGLTPQAREALEDRGVVFVRPEPA